MLSMEKVNFLLAFFFPATNNKCTYQAGLKYRSGLGQLDEFRKTVNSTVKRSVVLLTYNCFPLLGILSPVMSKEDMK